MSRCPRPPRIGYIPQVRSVASPSPPSSVRHPHPLSIRVRAGPRTSLSGGSMAVFNGVDFVRIDDLFTDEEKTIRQAVRDWVEDKYLPIVEHHYEDATFPMAIIPQIAELGVLGANLPQEYGCAG